MAATRLGLLRPEQCPDSRTSLVSTLSEAPRTRVPWPETSRDLALAGGRTQEKDPSKDREEDRKG